MALATQNAKNNLNLSKQRSRGYEWDKGQATTQARLITSQLNHKGQATKFKEKQSVLTCLISYQASRF